MRYKFLQDSLAPALRSIRIHGLAKPLVHTMPASLEDRFDNAEPAIAEAGSLQAVGNRHREAICYGFNRTLIGTLAAACVELCLDCALHKGVLLSVLNDLGCFNSTDTLER